MNTINYSNFFNKHFSISTWISSVISIILGFLGTLFFSKIMISIGILAVVSCISLLIIWLLLIIIFSQSKASNNPFKLELVRFNDNSLNTLCILKPCKYLSNDAYITIFHVDNNLEEYFATGIIINIQDNKLIQVKLLHIVNNTNLTTKAFSNDISFLNSLVIKPIITNRYLEECR